MSWQDRDETMFGEEVYFDWDERCSKWNVTPTDRIFVLDSLLEQGIINECEWIILFLVIRGVNVEGRNVIYRTVTGVRSGRSYERRGV